MPSQSSLSTIYYKRSVTTTDGTDISADVVSFAFVARGVAPVTGDWHVAVTLAPNVRGVLIGPANGGVILAAGQYDVWQKVADTTEVPVEPVDVLVIT